MIGDGFFTVSQRLFMVSEAITFVTLVLHTAWIRKDKKWCNKVEDLLFLRFKINEDILP